MGGCPPRSGTAPEASHPTEMRGALAHLRADSGMRPAAMLEPSPEKAEPGTGSLQPSRGSSAGDERGQSPEAAVGLPGLLLRAPEVLYVFGFDW